MRITFFFVMAFVVVLMLIERTCYRHVEDIKVEWNRRFGPHDDYAAPAPFSIDASQGNLPELFRKLDEFLAKPVPDEAQDSANDYSRGMPLVRLRELAEKWRYKFHWKERADALNSLGPQFKVSVNGLRIHYYDIRPSDMPSSNLTPMLLLHGWPGSFVEFAKLIPILRNKNRYGIVVPCLPGFGFSDAPKAQDSFTFLDAAVIFSKLMKNLYPSQPYICQGGDYGSFICSALAQIDGKRVLGVHLNMYVIFFPPWMVGGIFSWVLVYLFPFMLSQSNRERMHPSVPAVLMRMVQETGYFHVQASKPETIGHGLEDSPVFLLSWIAEKFAVMADSREKLIKDEEILDNIQIYWQTRTATSSARYYYYMVRSYDGAIASLLAPVPAKLAILDAPHEIFRPQTFWLKDHRYPQLQRFTETEKGGHFLAMETPEVLANDLDEFVNTLL